MPPANGQPFPSTHWSLVRRAGMSDANARREALALLLARYRPALLSHLRFARGIPAEEADDVLQAFIADHLLERQLTSRADPARGRFRAFLLTSLNNFAADHARAQRRRAAEPLETVAPVAAGVAPLAVVEAAWARALVRNVLEAMRRECAAAGRADVWAVFQGRILAETFGTGAVVPYETLAAALRLESPTQAANLLVTAKRMYARLLRTAVGEYENDPDAVEAEIADLRRTLAGGAAAQEAVHE
jgi:DNA-directed RNA polymerase specialized sigma24 family protein